MAESRKERVVRVLAAVLVDVKVDGSDASLNDNEMLAELLIVGRQNESARDILASECAAISDEVVAAVSGILEMHEEFSFEVFKQAEEDLRELAKGENRGNAIFEYFERSDLFMWGEGRDNQRLLPLLQDAFNPIPQKNAYLLLKALRYDRDISAIETLLPEASELIRR